MPTLQAERKSRFTTGQASAIVAVAALAWGGAWWWQGQQPPPVAVGHLEAGWGHFREGRIDKAEAEWLEAVRLSPKDTTAWEALGDLYLSTGQWEPARKAYQVVARLNPAAVGLWTKLARAEVRMGNAPGARLAVDEALKRDPNDAEALNILSTLLMRAEESRQRTEVLQRLAKLRPDDVSVLTKTADALMRVRRYPEAAPLIKRILELNPRSSSALSMRGALAFNQGTSPADLQKAEADLQAAIAQNSANWVARWYLGRTYLRLNQPAKAVAQLRVVDLVDPEDKNYLLDLATAYQQSGQDRQATATRERFAAAERQAHAIIELRSRHAASPNDFDTNLQLGLRLLESRKPGGAEDVLRNALRLRPKDARAQKAVRALEEEYNRSLAAGLQNLRARRGPEAARHLSRALHLRPHNPRTKKAVEQLAAALRVDFYQAVLQLERVAES